MRNFYRSRKYFETAYALARGWRGNPYDTYKIDNHYARLLLIEATDEGIKAKGMAAFCAALKILTRELARTEHIQYGYRIATEMANMFARLSGVLSANERKEFRDIAKVVIDRIQGLPQNRQEQRYVIELLKEMQNFLTAAT